VSSNTTDTIVNDDKDVYLIPQSETTTETMAAHIDSKCNEITLELDSMRDILDVVSAENTAVLYKDVTATASDVSIEPKIRWKQTIKFNVVGDSKSDASFAPNTVITDITNEPRHVRPKLTQKIPPVVPHQVRPKQTTKTPISPPTTAFLAAVDSFASKDVINETTLPTLRYKVKSPFGLKNMSALTAAVVKSKMAKQDNATLTDAADGSDTADAAYDNSAGMYDEVANMCDDDDDIFQDNIQKESSDEDDDDDADMTFQVPAPRSKKKKVA